jgi:hypothetical protein
MFYNFFQMYTDVFGTYSTANGHFHKTSTQPLFIRNGDSNILELNITQNKTWLKRAW